ncbi:MAG: hypothetical protein ABEI98_08675 [Halorhabdus sp.]
MIARVRLAGVLLAALLLLSGCLTGGPTTPTATPTASGTDGGVPDAGELRNETLTAMANVSAYTAVQHVTERNRTDNQTVQVVYALNRSTHRLAAHRRTTSAETTTTVDRYVIDKTLYQRRASFQQTYGTAWIKRDIADGFGTTWHLYDQLWRYRFMLDNASLSTVETDTINGTPVYVVETSVDTDEMNVALREALDFPPGTATAVSDNTSVHATFWIDQNTRLPVVVERHVTGPVARQEGRVPFERTITTRLTYETVSVRLPANASDATLVESS